MKVMRRAWSVIERVFDTLDALAALSSFGLLILLLATGHIPKSFELWAHALLGALLMIAIDFGLAAYKKSDRLGRDKRRA
jgi:hypothetical protein